MEDYYIGYYPIKESEIKQIVKCVKLYSKGEIEVINNILDKYNCKESIRRNVLSSIKKCINNKSERIFDIRYGVCIAKLQKIYRKNFKMEKLSLTELLKTNEDLFKYTKKWSDIFNFKQTKYQFVNYLKFPKSSGVYISAEKIKELYQEYNNNTNIKNIINSYYGDNVKKFLYILQYCLKNNCGLLEATGISKIVRNTDELHTNTEKHSEQKNQENNIYNNIEKNNTCIKNNDIKCRKIAVEIIGLFLMFSLSLSLIIYAIEKLIILKNTNNMLIKAIVLIIVQIPINIVFWKYIIKTILNKRTILKEEIKNIFVITMIFMIVYVSVSLIMKTIIINNQIQYQLKFGEEITKEEIEYAKYKISSTEESKRKLKKIEENIEKNKKEIYTEMYLYLFINCIYIIGMNFSMIYYEKRLLSRK